MLFQLMAIIWHTNAGHTNNRGIFSLSENNNTFYYLF